MKKITIITICDVCGGEGEFTGNPWTKDFKSHIDPRICVKNLKNKNSKKSKTELEIK